MKRFTQFLTEQMAVMPAPNMLKAFYLAGGPGSGKTSVAQDCFAVAAQGETAVSIYGLQYTNSDIAFEAALRAENINPEDLEEFQRTDPVMWNKTKEMRFEAERITDAQRNAYLNQRVGIVYDGTGRDYRKRLAQKEHAESLGYDTYLIFVQTPLDMAYERNEERTRRLPESVVEKVWRQTEANRPHYMWAFGEHFHEIADGNTLTTAIKRYVADCLSEPVQNPIGQQWLNKTRR